MTAEPEDDGRRVPAKVYPAILESGGWIVEAPVSDRSAEGEELRMFAGQTALELALEYAHVIYGSASCFWR